MADIDLQCPECGKTMRFSEFANEKAFVCRGCGVKLEKPSSTAGKIDSAASGLPSTADDKSEADGADEQIPNVWQLRRQSASRRSTRAKVSHSVFAWILFAVIAGFAGFMRYSNGLSEQHLELIRNYGWLFVIGCHVIIVLIAFEESVFQGILSLLVPLYSFYYFFLVCDHFYARAILGGILVGIGQDSMEVLIEKAYQAYQAVSAWIASGG